MQLKVLPAGLVVEVSPGESLLDALRNSGLPVNASCGGRGTCGKCVVRAIKGLFRAGTAGLSVTEGETVPACGTFLESDAVIEIPAFKSDIKRKNRLVAAMDLDIDPWVKKLYLELPSPDIGNQTPDWERLLGALKAAAGRDFSAGLHFFARLPELIRESDFHVTAVAGCGALYDIQAGDTRGDCYGIGIDLGTTTIAGIIVDMNTGEVAGAVSAANPQAMAGDDVISRIEYVQRNPGGLARLRRLVLGTLNHLVASLQEAVPGRAACALTVVGNTTMTHLMLGLNPRFLAQAPYVPVTTGGIELPAGDLGLSSAPGAGVYILPGIAGFVGSDTVASILASGIHRQSGIKLLIDIGTNVEIALGSENGLLVCSTAAGPAFEGAGVKCGMRAAEGAVEAVTINPDGVVCRVIGDITAEGICGSGIVQAVYQMLRAGVIDSGGRMAGPGELNSGIASRLGENEEGKFFALTDNVVITQQDVRRFQLAKGAVSAGVSVLIKELGIIPSDIDEVIMAGVFGNYLDERSLRGVGLIPPDVAAPVVYTGNAACTGALMALTSAEKRAEAESLAKMAKNVDLSTKQDFQEIFISSLDFPKTEWL